MFIKERIRDLHLRIVPMFMVLQAYRNFGVEALLSEPRVPEFCQDEKFTATCEADEVVLMESARFGRMGLGRCASKDLGWMGCAVDVLRLTDSRCSGQQSCEISVMDPALRKLDPCPHDVTWYLEAAYRCVKVVAGDRHACLSERHVKLSDESGFLASIISTQHGVGTSSCPWRIVAPPGQQINLTMYNFIPTRSASGEKAPDVCYELALLRDGTSHRSLTACSNEPRTRVAHVSQTNQVDIEFLVKPSHGRLQFLLHYSAFGCGTITPPPGAKASKKGETLTIRCETSGETWYLTCTDHRWLGEVGNCSTEYPAQKAWGVTEMFGSNTAFPYGILIVVAVGVALGVFLGGTLLAFVSMYMKKKRQAREPQSAPAHNQPFQQYSSSDEETLEERKTHNYTDYSSKTLDSHGTLQRDRESYKHAMVAHPPQYCSHGRPHMYESPKFV